MLDTKRHKSIFDASKFKHPVHVIGCGGMGSRVAEGLVRMGVGQKNKSPIVLYDDDEFAVHNLTNQWVSVPRLFMDKVDAVAAQMREINPQVYLTARSKKINRKVNMAGVVFVCVDSMSARRIIVDKVLAENEDVVCVIETRMDASVGLSHCFNPADPNQLACWRMYWHSDSEADNMQGCGGAQSIISAIYGTTTLALKQFEVFARTGSTADMANRVYHDFEECYVNSECWPTA